MCNLERRAALVSIILTTALLVAVDQFTKYLATTYLAPVGAMPFIPGVMELRYVLNDGMAFSLLSGKQLFLILVTGFALTLLAAYLLVKRPSNFWERFALILVLAGGIGNLIDRIRAGVVVDFFATTFIDFAVFNVADCFVCVGVALLFVDAVYQEVRNARKTKEATLPDAQKTTAQAQDEHHAEH
jgi:signal peptidase II